MTTLTKMFVYMVLLKLTPLSKQAQKQHSCSVTIRTHLSMALTHTYTITDKRSLKDKSTKDVGMDSKRLNL